MDEFDYKPNSNKAKEERKEEQKKIVKASVRRRKSSGFKKIANILLAEDIEDAKTQLVSDVIIPAIRQALHDIFDRGSNLMFLGFENRSGKSKASKVSYRDYYDNDKKSPERYKPQSRTLEYNDVIFDSKSEAEEVLFSMDELIEMYGSASVSDYYEFVGMTGDYSANNYGWTDIRNARIDKVRDGRSYGWTIIFPRARPLK